MTGPVSDVGHCDRRHIGTDKRPIRLLPLLRVAGASIRGIGRAAWIRFGLDNGPIGTTNKYISSHMRACVICSNPLFRYHARIEIDCIVNILLFEIVEHRRMHGITLISAPEWQTSVG